ncbi:MAG TPA: transcription elongation factor GreB [Gammaproteobacteria bacterium]|nr:transcription elongation factor GreB [Gammaproteobacteria bacterium]
MGRLRPDPPKPMAPSYITPEGHRRLREELDYLWRVRRPEVTRAVAEAAALGDRSENAEYIYGKRLLREIDRRIRFLRRRLEVLTVVDRPPPDTSRVFFGAWVRLEDEEGRESVYRLVGPDEFDHAKEYISIDSPLARALLKKAEGDEVAVELPKGRMRYWIVEVSYQPLQGEQAGP